LENKEKANLLVEPSSLRRKKEGKIAIHEVAVCFSGCFAVFSGETQVWLGDLRVVVFWWSCVFFGCST